jgi:hypothetical protein
VRCGSGLRRGEAIRVVPGSLPPPTRPSADSCSITGRVAPAGAVPGSGSLHGWASLGSLTAWRRPTARRLDLVCRLPPGSLPAEVTDPRDRPVEQVSPDKDVDFRCATAPFTLPLGPLGFVLLCGLAPGAGPSMAFLFVGSQLGRRLPSDLPSRRRPCLRLAVRPSHTISWARSSCRGLAPHQSTPMPGVHNALQRTGARDARPGC